MSEPFFDAHTHFPNEKGIFGVQNIMLSKSTDIPKLSDGQLYSVGIHPWEIKPDELDAVFEQLKTLSLNPNVVAIGECGLDKLTSTPWALQKQAFERQVAWSEHIGKPLIIHAVRSQSDILEIRQRTKAKQTWVIHAYNKSLQLAEAFINKGCVLSFGHDVLKNQKKYQAIFSQIPLDSFLIESDEKRVHLQDCYKTISNYKDIPLSILKSVQAENFNEIYKIKKP